MLRWSRAAVHLLGGDCVARVVYDVKIMSSYLRSSPEPEASIPLRNTRSYSRIQRANVQPVHYAGVTTELSLNLARPLYSPSTLSPPMFATLSRPKPISVLRQFLSSDTESTGIPHTHTPNTLRSLYLSIRSKKHLLTSSQLSNLISLFGSLSTNSSHSLRPLVRNINPSKTYWNFLAKLIKDKKSLGHKLSLVDRYWIMRSCLSRIDEKNDVNAYISITNKDLSAARVQYNHLRYNPEPSDVHVCFAEALLGHGSYDRLPEVVNVLCDMFNTQFTLDHSQLALMWKVILAVDHFPTSLAPLPEFPLKITDALRCRFRLLEPKTKSHVMKDPTQEREPDVHDLVLALQSSISPFPSNLQAFPILMPWIVHETRIALSLESNDDATLAFLWRNICYMALVYSPLDVHTRIQCLEKCGRLNATDWQIVCILAVLDNVIKQSDGGDHPRQIFDRVIDILEPVWDLWVQAGNQNYQARPIAIDRAIAAVILRIAGTIRDRSLQINCRQYGLSRGFWLHQWSPLLPIEYAIATVSCGEQDWCTIFPDLKEHPSSDRIVEETITRCITRDLNLASAHDLYVSSKLQSMELSSNTIATLGRAMARADPELGVIYLNDRRLCPQELGQILESLLNSPAGLENVEKSPRRLVVIGEAMSSVYAGSCPALELRGRVEAVLLAMMRTSTDCGLKAVQIMEKIHRISANFLRAEFISIGLQRLVFHRFFRVALRLFHFAANAYVGQSQRWQRVLFRGFARGKAHAFARRLYKTYSHPPPGRVPTISLLRTVNFDVHRPTRVATLKILRKVKKDDIIYGREFGYAITILVRGRRILAAKTLYMRSRNKVEDASRTVAGNAILHASWSSTRRRNAQRIRKFLRTLQELINDYGFVPDRVTINIFVKGILMWGNAIDNKHMRGLFDHLISNGYPGGVCSEKGSIAKPFNTNTSSILPGVPLVDPSLPILFERHVRPLYKMFIKEFHRRGDREAAWVVVGILKRASSQTEQEKGKRRTVHSTSTC